MALTALKRLLAVIPVMVGVCLLVFALLSVMPGDPVLNLMGERVSEEAAAAKRAQLGLDQPWPVQWGRYVVRLVQGDMGHSVRRFEPVSTLLLTRLPYTLALASLAMVWAVLLGVSLGIAAGSRPGTATDSAVMLFGLLGISTPVFWLGILLLFVFSLRLGVLPAGGAGQAQGLALVTYLLLPSLTLGLRSGALLSRFVRAQWMESRHAQFLISARAKGLSGLRLWFNHQARPHLGPVCQVVGLDFASYLTGSVVTETIFTWPGLGSLMFDAIRDRDLPVLSGAILLCALIFAVVLLLVDLVQAWADPRAREGVA